MIDIRRHIENHFNFFERDQFQTLSAIVIVRCCAFGVVLFSDHVAYPLYVGVNYDLNNDYELYFNTMFAMFEASLHRGVKLVSWGQTADQFKQMVGHYIENHPMRFWNEARVGLASGR